MDKSFFARGGMRYSVGILSLATLYWLLTTITGHRILWKYGVRHRGISASNLVYYKTSNGLIIGVLNDYDLSSMRDTPTGTERTGTVPFMAVDLLTQEALQGKVAHEVSTATTPNFSSGSSSGSAFGMKMACSRAQC